MQIETNAEALKSAFNLMHGVIKACSRIPILSHVKLSNGVIVGTDLDMEVTAKVAGKIKGETCLPWQQVNRLLGHIPVDEIITGQDEGSQKGKAAKDLKPWNDEILALSFNGATYRFPTLPANDYPEFLGNIDGPTVQIGNAGLLAAIRKVAFAICPEKTRYYLNGIFFCVNSDGIPGIVATNGHQLAWHPLPFEIEGMKGKILPREAVDYILSRKVEPQSCQFGDMACQFDWPGLTLKSKLIDGTYPNYERVIPKGEFPHRIVIDPAKWLPILSRVVAVQSKRFRGVKIAIDTDGKTTISASDPNMGACVEVAPTLETGKPYEVGFNASYLIDCLQSFAGFDTVEIIGQHSGAPHKFTSPDAQHFIVQMPMRV